MRTYFQGIQAYSIGNCQMPESCQLYCSNRFKDRRSVDSCYLKLKLDQVRDNEDANSFIKLAKLTYHRRTKFNVDLERADTFYHFGNVKNPDYRPQSLLTDAINSRLTKITSQQQLIAKVRNYFSMKSNYLRIKDFSTC